VATEQTVWAQRQVFADARAKTARPVLLDAKLSAERVIKHICNKCHAGEAFIRCLDCVPLDMEFLCGSCDIEAHKKNVFHNREAIFHGYLEPIPHTTAVVLDDNGQPHFCEQGMFRAGVSAEFYSNPNQAHLIQLIKVLLGRLDTLRQVC